MSSQYLKYSKDFFFNTIYDILFPMKRTFLILMAGLAFPLMGNATCDTDSFNACMDNTCFKPETDICLCHSDFAKSASRMENLSTASQEIEKIISTELGKVAEGQIKTNIESRIRRTGRLLSPSDDMAIPTFDDSILGEEMIPAGNYGTNYGKTRLTEGWNTCKSYVDTCKASQIPLKNYLQKAGQACSRLEQHLNKESEEIRAAMDRAEKLFDQTKSRQAHAIESGEKSCEGELDACMRRQCKGIYYLECYRAANCEKDDRSGCKKSLTAVFESKKNKCEAQLNKCGSKKNEAWNSFIDDRIDDIPDYLDKE